MPFRNGDHAREGIVAACELTLKNLKLEYLDLYLIHWPQAMKHGVNLSEMTDEDKIGYSPEGINETWKVFRSLLLRSTDVM